MDQALGRLSELKVGERALIVGVTEGHPLFERLLDLGWTEGTPIRCVQVSPLGDPKAYAIRGSVIALRRRDSDGVLIRRREEDEDVKKKKRL